MLAALIFDVDGTLADTEEAHRQAFNMAFQDARLGWHWDRALYARLLDVAGGKERLQHYWRLTQRAAPPPGLLDTLHAGKTRHYAHLVAGVSLRDGVPDLFEEARAARLALAIATTTTPANIDALLRPHLGPHWRRRFAAIGDGASVGASGRKKPAPDVYLAVLAQLGAGSRSGLGAAHCLAFEDSMNGLAAARAAGIATIVTPTAYTAHHDFSGALAVQDRVGTLAALRTIHRQHLGDRHEHAPAPDPDAIPDRRTPPLSARQRRLQ